MPSHRLRRQRARLNKTAHRRSMNRVYRQAAKRFPAILETMAFAKLDELEIEKQASRMLLAGTAPAFFPLPRHYLRR